MKLSTKLKLGALIAVVLAAIPNVVASDSKSKTKNIVLTDKNVVTLGDVITPESTAAVLTEAKSLDESGNLLAKVGVPRKEMYLFLRTPGGDIQAGLELLEGLKGLKRPVSTITSFAASMGFQTAQNLGKRYILKSGVLMSHRARGGFEGEFGGQRPSQVDSRKSFWESRLDEMDQETVTRTNGKQTMESYQKAYASEMWVTGTQAVDQGYADEVVTITCDSSLKGVTTHKAEFMGMPLLYDIDKCPLNSAPMNIRIANILTNKGTMPMEQFMAVKGEFGSACLMASGKDESKVCASDTSLTLEVIVKAKEQFKSEYHNNQMRARGYGI